ncbi:MAG: glycosyltransferase [Lachnospiraceae bacterium]|nr:glycosyltransferase [Lachnospiraceae bacterium]
MRLLIYNWTFITKHDLYLELEKMGIEFDLFTSNASPRFENQRDQFRDNLQKALKRKSYDAVFSINFYEDLANAAHEKGILYICWTYDSPALGGVRNCHFLDTNRIFLFDSAELEEYRKCDIPNLYYLPLAVNVKRLNQMKPSPMEQMKYHSDVSLVGRLYQSDMDKMFPLFDEYSAGYVAAIINTQLNIYGTNIVKELINADIMKRICNEEVTDALVKNLNDDFFHDVNELKSWLLASFLLKAVTNKERVLLLTLLAKYFHVKLFTTSAPKLPGVHTYSTVDYVSEMPMVFKCSKINLNITLRTIRNGIPQRVIDIMGCRSLVLTNYQKDIEEYFKDGRDLLMYSSVEEALDKCKYYLTHKEEADKIRLNGYKIVRDQFSYEHQLNRIWELSGLKAGLPG